MTTTAIKAVIDKQSVPAIGFIGAGNMAAAIVAGLVRAGWPSKQIRVSNPSQEKLIQLERRFGIVTETCNNMVVKRADVLLLCVKPQRLAEVCQPLRPIDFSDKLCVSIVAGWSMSKIEEHLQQS